MCCTLLLRSLDGGPEAARALAVVREVSGGKGGRCQRAGTGECRSALVIPPSIHPLLPIIHPPHPYSPDLVGKAAHWPVARRAARMA